VDVYAHEQRGRADRIRLLRDVDDSVWQLVSELSRVKSEWEAEDGELAEDVAS
jgi:E3 ubiquitin-protein ligase synoviolin